MAQEAHRKERLRDKAAAALLGTYTHYTTAQTAQSSNYLARARTYATSSSATTTAESSTSPCSSLEGMVVVFGGACIRQHLMCQDVAVITVTTLTPPPPPSASAASSSASAQRQSTYNPNPTLSYQWHRPEVYGRFPVHRVDHAAAKLYLPSTLGGPRMVVHGGMGPGGAGFLSDIHSLRIGDGDVMEWESVVVTGEIPPGRGNHTLLNIPSRDLSAMPSASSFPISGITAMDVLVLFGGHTTTLNAANPDQHGGLNNNSNNHLWNDVHCLRLDQAKPATDASSLSAFTLHFRWSKVRVDSGVPPTPRSSHSVCLVANPTTARHERSQHPNGPPPHHRMIVFGGGMRGATKRSILSDVQALNINREVTRTPQPGQSTWWQWHTPDCTINPFPHISSDTDTPSENMKLLLPPSSLLPPLRDANDNAMDYNNNEELELEGRDNNGSCTLLPDLLDLLFACQSTTITSSSSALTSGGGDVVFVAHPAEGTDGDTPGQHADGTAIHDHDAEQTPGTVRFSAHRAILRARRYYNCFLRYSTTFFADIHSTSITMSPNDDLSSL